MHMHPDLEAAVHQLDEAEARQTQYAIDHPNHSTNSEELHQIRLLDTERQLAYVRVAEHLHLAHSCPLCVREGRIAHREPCFHTKDALRRWLPMYTHPQSYRGTVR
jgi:hypothetical protein